MNVRQTIDRFADGIDPLPLPEIADWVQKLLTPMAVFAFNGGPRVLRELNEDIPDSAKLAFQVNALSYALHIYRLTRDVEDARARIAELEAELQLRDAGEPPAVDLRGPA